MEYELQNKCDIVLRGNCDRHFSTEHKNIDELLYDLMNGTGIYSLSELFGNKWDKEDPLGNSDFNMNLLAWFGFEETMRNIGCKFEQLQDCI